MNAVKAAVENAEWNAQLSADIMKQFEAQWKSHSVCPLLHVFGFMSSTLVFPCLAVVGTRSMTGPLLILVPHETHAAEWV